MYRFRHMFGHRFERDKKQLTLAQMQTGQSGEVLQIIGGHGMISRLSAMGIRPGLRLTKVSSQIMRGPVTVQLGNTQVAVGFGMARRILVKPE